MSKYNYEQLAGISFQIITYAGSAKSDAMMAIYAAKEGKFDEAEKNIKEAEKNLIEAEKQHASLVQDEATGESINIPLLLMHAEDQMLTTQTLILMAKEFIDLYKKIK